MTDIWSSIQNKPMNLVALYGTHDSGMSVLDFASGFGSVADAGIIKTQNWGIADQIVQVRTSPPYCTSSVADLFVGRCKISWSTTCPFQELRRPQCPNRFLLHSSLQLNPQHLFLCWSVRSDLVASVCRSVHLRLTSTRLSLILTDVRFRSTDCYEPARTRRGRCAWVVSHNYHGSKIRSCLRYDSKPTVRGPHSTPQRCISVARARYIHPPHSPTRLRI